MDNLSDDIIKYKKGLLSPKEMHALEKKALNDPFLAEALEGSDAISSDEFAHDVYELNSKINSKRRIVFTPLRIAAGLLLMAASIFLVYQFVPKTETISLNQEKTKEQQPSSAQPEEKKSEEVKARPEKQETAQPPIKNTVTKPSSPLKGEPK